MTTRGSVQPEPVCDSVILSKQKCMMGLRGGEWSTAGLSQERATLQFGFWKAAGERMLPQAPLAHHRCSGQRCDWWVTDTSVSHSAAAADVLIQRTVPCFGRRCMHAASSIKGKLI